MGTPPRARRSKEMAYKIDAEQCLGCGACKENCPVEAIAQDGDKYKIDAATCVDCGTCAGNCPASAIAAE